MRTIISAAVLGMTVAMPSIAVAASPADIAYPFLAMASAALDQAIKIHEAEMSAQGRKSVPPDCIVDQGIKRPCTDLYPTGTWHFMPNITFADGEWYEWDQRSNVYIPRADIRHFTNVYASLAPTSNGYRWYCYCTPQVPPQPSTTQNRR